MLSNCWKFQFNDGEYTHFPLLKVLNFRLRRLLLGQNCRLRRLKGQEKIYFPKVLVDDQMVLVIKSNWAIADNFWPHWTYFIFSGLKVYVYNPLNRFMVQLPVEKSEGQSVQPNNREKLPDLNELPYTKYFRNKRTPRNAPPQDTCEHARYNSSNAMLACRRGAQRSPRERLWESAIITPRAVQLLGSIKIHSAIHQCHLYV